jgi:hypothetical protein
VSEGKDRQHDADDRKACCPIHSLNVTGQRKRWRWQTGRTIRDDGRR